MSQPTLSDNPVTHSPRSWLGGCRQPDWLGIRPVKRNERASQYFNTLSFANRDLKNGELFPNPF
jgi:hypothetical protein